ncbi:hypothetical protein [Blastomonas sp.]|uniref:hypothetical protein n=1 Tax=Blastomonas sp. TaxID=1909299 RepID=UPI00359354AD
MEKMSARDTLAKRYKAMAETDGLVDVKFYLRNTEEATTEQVCREVCAMYEALDNSESKPLVF